MVWVQPGVETDRGLCENHKLNRFYKSNEIDEF